ncbi:hypothetical protein H9Q13_07485 [Pontibacter sp. JH31]|uniref:Uncharacterized protein n=1 Tax=Pontibacter aquaedesilientis TaxID=2766980 RepID=A0ABR7XHA3_9BACT|nr:hypothetical protein [Pontibacter aquaedesilientis]MBD1397003.1 hypothetical protein [Pontibacter aquaedesilientis]
MRISEVFVISDGSLGIDRDLSVARLCYDYTLSAAIPVILEESWWHVGNTKLRGITPSSSQLEFNRPLFTAIP